MSVAEDSTAGRIQKARKAAKLTQQGLADKTGISLSTIRQYERGVFKPRIEKLLILAKALHVPVHQLKELPTIPKEGNVTEVIRKDDLVNALIADMNVYECDMMQLPEGARMAIIHANNYLCHVLGVIGKMPVIEIEEDI